MKTDTIYNMDCLDGLRHLPDNCIDMVVTDPPYELATYGGGAFGSKKRQYYNDLEDSKITDGFDIAVLDELVRVMKKINIYIWCSQKQLIPLLAYFVEGRRCNYNIITWHKTNPVPACGNKYLTDTEYCLFFREKGVKVYGDFKTKFTYYVTPLNQKDKKKYNHPTVKPLDIIKNLIINSSNENDIILDPFMGSGTTAVGCKELNRRFIGYELNENYYNICMERLWEEDDL